MKRFSLYIYTTDLTYKSLIQQTKRGSNELSTHNIKGGMKVLSLLKCIMGSKHGQVYAPKKVTNKNRRNNVR